jgi:hypothetical protein
MSEVRNIFIVGPGRSGTSFTLKLINQLPRVYLSFEGRMLKQGIRLFQDRADDFTSFSQRLEQLICFESETNRNAHLIQYIKENKRSLFEVWTSHFCYRHLINRIYSGATGAQVIGDKVLRSEYIYDLMTAFPDARFLYVVRDPRSVYLSQHLKWNYRLKLSAIYWKTNLCLAQQIASKNSSRFMFIRYEDLILDKYATGEKIEKFIGLGLTQEGISRWIESQEFRTTSLEKWKEVLSTSEIERIEGFCFNGLKEYRYEFLSTADREITVSRLGYLVELFREYGKVLLEPRKLIEKNLLLRLKRMLFNQ